MTLPPDDLATRLLDAHTTWQLAQLHGDGLTEFIERAVAEIYDAGSRLRLRDVVPSDALSATLRRAAQIVADSQALADLATDIPVRVHAMAENADHRLDEVAARADVEEFVAAILDLDRWHERSLDRLTGSPLVGVVASAFVTRLVSDVLAQNTDLARKLPGMSSLLSIGGSAVARARGLADRQLEGVLGEAMGKGGELAVRRVNAALLAVLRTGPVRGAVLESWDLEADEPIASLTADLPPGGVRRLAEAVYALVAGAADTAYGDVVIDTCVEVLLERHGDDDIAGLLTTLGLERADLGEALDRALRPALDTLHATGDLERIIRTGIEPFYASDEVRRLLADVPRRSTRRPRQTGGERADP